MKFWCTHVVFLLAFGSINAEPQQLSLFPEQEVEQRVEYMLEQICEKTHNGGCGTQDFNAKKFNYSKTLQKLIESYVDEDRFFQYDFDLKWDYILENYYVVETGLAEELKFFRKNRLIKAMFAFYPNEDQCTESEYCSIYHVYIYLKNGTMVYFDFDFTT